MESKASILLVDDRPENLMTLEASLSGLGQNLVKARSGKEALRCLLREDFAAIVLDVQMPGMDGFETADLIRAREKSRHTPIIFLTGTSLGEESAARGYSLGAVDYLVKPFVPAILAAKVSVFVEMFKNSQEIKRQAARLAEANRELEGEIRARRRAETEVRKLNAELGERVRERTAQLEKANRDLQAELLERKRVERGLRIAQERLDLIFRYFPMAIYTAVPDAEFAATWISDNTERLTGFPARRFLEEPSFWISRLHPEDREPVRKAFESRRQTGSVQVEYRWQCADGSYRWFLDQGILVQENDDAARQILGTRTDVTEHKKLEAQFLQAQKMEVIGCLAGGVAHDFNNLLTIITGFGQLVFDGIGSEHPLRKHVEEILHAGERAAALTRQLLAFSRRQVLTPRVLDLSSVVAGMDKMLTRLIGEDIQLETHLEKNRGRVKADPGQIEQVIMNLAVNARDAMPNGGKLIIETADVELDAAYVRRHGRALAGRFVELAVSDTGCGMDAETQLHIFEPFFTTKEQGKGTGLGLATVYGIVKQTGGDIWLYSEPGRGTTFKIYLPRVEEAAESVAPARAGESAACGSETILVVEDESGVRKLARDALEAKGYRVLEARHGEEALKVAQAYQASIDLMLTDMVMPQMSGYDLANRLIALRPSTKVIFMSGYTDKAAAQQEVLEPGAPFLQKPFTLDSLARKVREVLDAPPALERPSASGAPS